MNKTPSSHIEPNQKLRNLEQEKAQAEHRSQRLQNRERYLSEGARKKRTHHLCNMGGAIEALCPQVAALNKADFYRVMERIFALSEVQDRVPLLPQHIAQANACTANITTNSATTRARAAFSIRKFCCPLMLRSAFVTEQRSGTP